MGKKGRKTRWRTLTITDEHSDSEESNTTTSGHRVSKGYPQKSYYSRFTYSSQSTPTRRYQCDGTKSTRSSSTASENKITFNEDEYTRITTPRQDVLFKKGYLNKPKTYQTQTSTGNSTTSTGNSTGNGTPDHQSTDLEYESQFVFPNGFVDQNGIYYVNSFEPYPVMVFNPPTYYPDYTSVKSKRCSTGSLTESTSPNNEEASQDLSQSETSNNISDFSHMYNVIYPGFYFNGACQPQDVANHHQPEHRRIKKKRRRKLSRSKSVHEATTSEYTDESSDEVFSDHQQEKVTEPVKDRSQNNEEKVETQQHLMNGLSKENHEDSIEEEEEDEEEPEEEVEKKVVKDVESQNEEETMSVEESKKVDEEVPTKPKFDLKPDAEEFVPRAYRHPEIIPMEANVQFIKIPSNFVPLPILNPLTDFNAFIPPGIPINFIPQNYVNYIPNYVSKTESVQSGEKQQISEKVDEEAKETVEVPKNQIDIAKIVSKLEEAAKEQDETGKEESNEKKTNAETPPKPFTRKVNGSGRNFKKTRYQKLETKPPEEDKNNTEPKEPQKPMWKLPNSPKKEILQVPQTVTPKTFVRNYSDTLKKTQTPPQTPCERHEKHMERQKLNKIIPKEVIVKNHAKSEPASSKAPDQWISVSNRKKRKNKNMEETEELLEEVTEKEIVLNNSVEEAIMTVPQTQEPLVEETPPPVQELEVVIEETKPIKIEETSIIVEVKEEVKEEKMEKVEKTKPITKKKSKKNNNNQKPVTRRVIIKDADLTQELEKAVNDVKPVEEIVEKQEPPIKIKVEEVVVDEVEEKKVEPFNEKVNEEIIEEKIEETVAEKKGSPEKKVKKKKKKIVKPPILSSQSSSSTTLNMIEDSYDFLLESSLLDESSREKTNVEISQELDKMIQRGMYSSLEEKIKSLNIEPSDNFFKAIINNISSRESSVEKNSYGKTPDFGKILNNTTHLLKTKPTAMDLKKLGNFLGEETPKTTGVETKETETNHEDELYPITKAVKEWMTKTRETTPDVEIFKSPSTIFREFNNFDEDQKNWDGNSLPAELLNGDPVVDDEVTVYSLSKEGSQDLLDYWEDPVPEKKSTRTSSSSLEEGEDVLEEYESKYGKNEDYLRIRKEVDEKMGNYPKHGNLPYRAICCSIM